MYWAIVTVTTTEYGDIHPKTPFGQLMKSMAMLLGYGIIALPTGIVGGWTGDEHDEAGTNQAYLYKLFNGRARSWHVIL